MKITIPLVLLALLIMLTGCATNAMTGRSQLIFVSEKSAIEQSAKHYSSMIESYDKKSKISDDVIVNYRVTLITNRLVERAILYRPDSQSWDWQVNVVQDDNINAFCMAGGKMVVNTGLLEKINPTDDELAQVMGHEIAHALANHTAEKMSVDMLGKIAVAAVTIAVASADTSNNQAQRNRNMQSTQDMSMLAAAAFVTLPNSRGAETEADKLGIELAAQAGYNPDAAITLWQKMMDASGEKTRGDFMNTHPSSIKRIEALQALNPPMKKIYDSRYSQYAEYKPSVQYVRSVKNASGFSSSNVRVIDPNASSSLTSEKPTIDPTQAMAFYSQDYDAIKDGEAELKCTNCSFSFYLKHSDIKKLHAQQDWRGLAQKVIKVGYKFDLSYYYLGEAARGLGMKESAKVYYTKARELSASEDATCAKAKMIKCDGVDIASSTIK